MKYFMYCRKSSEDEERQALSIPSQRSELAKVISGKPEISIVGVIEEERSAMKPGRPAFGDMLKRIERGEADGIITWAPDRLARNSIDGGQIVYLLDTGALKDLKFATYTFENNPQGKFMLQIMFGQSKYYSDALSENVKRGNRTKIEMGWRPNQAPLGYLNDPVSKTTIPDPVRFPIIRQMWDLMLTGVYTAEAIRQKANEEWSFRTRTTPKHAGGPMQSSTAYKLFTSPFYAGILVWEGVRRHGAHVPMVTVDEFERVQDILARRGKPQPKKHVFAYTGLIKCGACGQSVTAEKKVKRNGRTYSYYHCTWRKRPRCTERAITEDQMHAQAATFVGSLSIPSDIEHWALDRFDAMRTQQAQTYDATTKALQREASMNERELRELTNLRLRELIADDEFLTKRNELHQLKDQLRERIAMRTAEPDFWFEPARAVASFSKNAVSWILDGDEEDWRLILATACSNATLKGKILSPYAAEPFVRMPKKQSVPDLLAFVGCIRKMYGTSALSTAVSAIQRLEARAASRALEAACEPRASAA